MLVFIYPDRKEYVKESKKLGMGDVGWTAGYLTGADETGSDFVRDLSGPGGVGERVAPAQEATNVANVQGNTAP